MNVVIAKVEILQSEYVLLHEKLSSLITNSAPLPELMQVYKEIRALHKKSMNLRVGKRRKQDCYTYKA